MLKILNLYVIKSIFENSKVKITSNNQILYINCLMHFFKDKEATEFNCKAFEILTDDIPSFDKFKNNFKELHRIGLVVLSDTKVEFPCLWRKYIDIDSLSKTDYKEGVKNASDYKDEILRSTMLIETITRKNQITKAQVLSMLDIFVSEQDSTQKTYSSYSDTSRHFMNWVRTNLEKVPKVSGTVVRTKSKILGME